MTPRAARHIQLREARELRHGRTWDDLLRRIRAAREKAVRPIERKAART